MNAPNPGRKQESRSPTDVLDRIRRFLENEFLHFISISTARKKAVRNEIVDGSDPGFRYYLLMTIATLIAALGLVINSPAVIIGAMLISPLMTPIFGVSLGLISADVPLWRKALVTEAAGVGLAIFSGFLIGLLPLYFKVTPEMLARTQPTLLDLGVATLAGIAGCLAMIDERISPVLPGIAIATSLVPPLAASGLCFALGAPEGGIGAFLLFFANFLAILLVSGAVFIAAGFVSKWEMGSAWSLLRRFSSPLISLLVVGFLLTRTLLGAVNTIRTTDTIESTITAELSSEPATLLNGVKFKEHGGLMDILASLQSSDALSPHKIKLIEEKLAERLGIDVNLVVRSLIVKDVSAKGSTSVVVDENLNGEFISDNLNPRVKRIQLAEQALREVIDNYTGVYLRDVDLIELEDVPVILATVQTSRPVTAGSVEKVEKQIQKRLQDPKVRLVVRAEDLVGVTSKGRILYGQAHLGTLYPDDQSIQNRVEHLVKKTIEGFPEMYAINVDAYQDGEIWKVRAEVVGPRILKPGEIANVETRVGTEIGGTIHLETWSRAEIVVSRDGYVPREGYTESKQSADQPSDSEPIDAPHK